MKTFQVFLATSFMSLISMAPSALADTTYTYQGNPMPETFGSPACQIPAPVQSCVISGSFTVASSLGDDLNNVLVTPESFSFTDTVNVISSGLNTSEPGFSVSTDDNGNIDAWFIYVDVPGEAIFTENDSEQISDYTFTVTDNVAQNFRDPGTWTTEDPIATPEPSSLLLLSSGLFGLGFLKRKLFHG